MAASGNLDFRLWPERGVLGDFVLPLILGLPGVRHPHAGRESLAAHPFLSQQWFRGYSSPGKYGSVRSQRAKPRCLYGNGSLRAPAWLLYMPPYCVPGRARFQGAAPFRGPDPNSNPTHGAHQQQPPYR